MTPSAGQSQGMPPLLPGTPPSFVLPSTRPEGTAVPKALAPYHVLTVPGLYGSDDTHWQTCWQNLLPRQGVSCSRVEQDNWDEPDYTRWATRLEQSLRDIHQPVLLAGHSLGAILSARWAGQNPQAASKIAGALLVAPADTEEHNGADRQRVADFRPLPTRRLPFPSILVTSANDPWITPTRARYLALQWGSTFVPMGAYGHMGNSARLHDWATGLSLLGHLARSRTEDARL